MPLCIEAESVVREAADESIREVFSMMIGESVNQSSCEEMETGQLTPVTSDRALTVLLGLTGEIQGSLSLSMGLQAALEWTRALIDHEATEIDQTVVDAVGELGNMVVGGTKRRLGKSNLGMSLPTVFRASEDSLVFPSNTFPTRITYDYCGHPIALVIALHRG